MRGNADETEHLLCTGPDATVAGFSLIGKQALSSAPLRGRSMAGVKPVSPETGERNRRSSGPRAHSVVRQFAAEGVRKSADI